MGSRMDISRDLLDRVVGIAREAGAEIMEVYAGEFEVEVKDDASPVTEADRRAEVLILAALEETAPGVPVVAEESFAAGHIPEVADAPFWLVDPLDGTKEFIKRNGEFTVNIALIEDGLPVLGVVHAPAIGVTYWGGRLGAFAETAGADPKTISCRPAPDDGLVAVVSRSHRTPEIDAYLSRLEVSKEISAGSSLKLCLVAEGRADIYPRLGRTMEWDIAAGHAVLYRAGGRVMDLEGGEMRYGKPGFENPHFVARGA